MKIVLEGKDVIAGLVWNGRPVGEIAEKITDSDGRTIYSLGDAGHMLPADLQESDKSEIE